MYLILVLPYHVADMGYYEKYYDEIIIPDELNGVHYKWVIIKRNDWMLNITDVVFVYRSKKFFRFDKLGEGYTEADINSRLRYRFNRAKAAEYSPFVPEKKEKPKGLYALYLYYCYLLGELPKTKPESREAYDSMKEDRKYLNRISEEAKLLGKYHIDTAEQLSLFTAGKSAEFKSLATQRKKLRNKLGRMHDTEAMQPIKEQISVLSDRMSTIRKEMKLCEDVAERSGAIEAVVNTIFDPRQAEKIKQTEKEREKGEERK